ncbi:MAG: AhpD family alkylhydroperoxidase [Candidatus Latescibacterota bacterium]|jgi:AhpD family alkylhydroperoxidase
MPHLQALDPKQTSGETKALLDGVQAKVGMTPKLIRTLANGPAALKAYLDFSNAMSTSSLPARLREQIALTIAQTNDCQYCLAAHTAIGKMVGLSKEETLDSRRAISNDSKTQVALNTFTNYFNHVADTEVDFPPRRICSAI